jgi:hypothetical protein
MKVTRSGPANNRIQVYVCTRQPKLGVDHVTTKREPLDEYVTKSLIDGMLEQGVSTVEPTMEPETTDTSDLDEAQEALAAELAAGRLPVAAWTAANAQLSQRRAELEARAADAAGAQVISQSLGEFELDPAGTWESLTLDEKRGLLGDHVTVTVLPAASRSRWTAPVRERVRLEFDWNLEPWETRCPLSWEGGSISDMRISLAGHLVEVGDFLRADGVWFRLEQLDTESRVGRRFKCVDKSGGSRHILVYSDQRYVCWSPRYSEGTLKCG